MAFGSSEAGGRLGFERCGFFSPCVCCGDSIGMGLHTAAGAVVIGSGRRKRRVGGLVDVGWSEGSGTVRLCGQAQGIASRVWICCHVVTIGADW